MGVPSDDLDKAVVQAVWDEAKQIFYKEPARRDSSSVLQPTFEDLAKVHGSRVNVIVDALDECFDWMRASWTHSEVYPKEEATSESWSRTARKTASHAL